MEWGCRSGLPGLGDGVMGQNLDLWAGGRIGTMKLGLEAVVKEQSLPLGGHQPPEPRVPGPSTSSCRRGWVQMAVSGYADRVAWV